MYACMLYLGGGARVDNTTWLVQLCQDLLMEVLCIIDPPIAGGVTSIYSIERLRLTSPAVKHPQHSPFYSITLIRLQGKKVVSSTVILETQAAWHLPSTTVSTVTVAQLPACQLN